MVTTRPPKTIVKPTALGPVANTDTKLLIYSLFQQGRVLAQDGVLRVLRVDRAWKHGSTSRCLAHLRIPGHRERRFQPKVNIHFQAS